MTSVPGILELQQADAAQGSSNPTPASQQIEMAKVVEGASFSPLFSTVQEHGADPLLQPYTRLLITITFSLQVVQTDGVPIPLNIPEALAGPQK